MKKKTMLEPITLSENALNEKSKSRFAYLEKKNMTP
jgi:hypothetical protein